MIDDPNWTVPGNGALDVRPGTNLHFMLINFDPAKAVDGRVALTLTFRDAGTVIGAVELPFQLATSEAFTVSVSDIRLDANQNDTICPTD